MTTKEDVEANELQASADTAAVKAKAAIKQTSAAISAHDEELKAQAEARMKAVGLDPQREVTGPFIEVKTAPGPNGARRPRYVKGGQRFSDKPRPVPLSEISLEQYRAIMSAPLLLVKGSAPKDFDGWATI